MEPGQTVYSPYMGYNADASGVFTTILEGTVSEILTSDGPLIRTSGNGHLEPASQWYATKNEALLELARRVEDMRFTIAAKLRKQADEIRTKVRNSQEVAA